MDDRQIGGLGIYLYQQLMDTVTYQRTEEGSNVLTMTKVIGIEN
jgi:anti-sigma regulatory factor (Ser/Thr protein kinase)